MRFQTNTLFRRGIIIAIIGVIGALSQLVTYLEQRGLLERVPDPTDRRATLIRATPRADRGFAVARNRLAEIEHDWERIIGAQQLRVFADTLHRLEDWHQATDTPPGSTTAAAADPAGPADSRASTLRPDANPDPGTQSRS